MERMTGFEPATMAWEAIALPLGYIRSAENIIALTALLAQYWATVPCAISSQFELLAEATGVEPAVSCVTGRHVGPLHHASA